MHYAKLINNYPSYAPRKLLVDNSWVYNPLPEQLLAEGFLPVIETDAPETDEQHYAVASWRIDNDKIVEEWSILEIPDNATADDYENALEDMGVRFSDEG